jgi:HPt (histidine-containing phosphotransfer) domain-containing protein
MILFEKEGPKILAEAEAALASQDGKTLERAAHSIKGAAGYFFATEIVTTARELEVQARRNDLGGAAVLIGQLSDQLRRLLTEFEAYTRKVGS